MEQLHLGVIVSQPQTSDITCDLQPRTDGQAVAHNLLNIFQVL